ncbi:thioredoxin peroxidase dot5 [Cytospora paraplurivora]|uniref:thioredoxin-dependent peroxiredoxin n=1 Tax=Cytospora paraplurivora TaxID=2898453 RepID=A0AAN9YHW2_9PEZI
MPVELRKRKAPVAAPAPEPPAKKQSKVSKAASKAKTTVKGKKAQATPKPKPEAAPRTEAAPKSEAAPKTNGAKASAPKKPEVGDTIDLSAFGGEVSLNDGTTTTLASLVEKSGSGVVLFTYPKASTPGCTNQACLFRDSYEPLTAGGLAIYGLSRDSTKSNTSFKTKQKLPYPLISDLSGSLIEAIGLKKAPSSTQRGVFVIDKKGKVLLAEPGSPAGTAAAVKKLVESEAANGGATEEEKEGAEDKEGETKDDEKKEDEKEEDEKAEDEKKEEKKEEEGTEEDKEGKKDKEEDEEKEPDVAPAKEAKDKETEDKE